MQIPIIPFRGQKKPWPSIPRINWGHPLARGLLFYGYDTGSGLIVDLVSGVVPVAQTRPSTAPSLFGSGTKYTSGGAGVFYPAEPVINRSFLASRYSIACAWNITALPTIAFTCPFGMTDAATNTACAVLLDSTAAADIEVTFANGTGAVFSANSINKFHSVVGTNRTATAQNIYFDGALNTTSALTAAFTTSITAACFNTSVASATAAGNGVAGWVYYGAFWNRTISAQEAFILHNDPWCFLIYPEDEMFATMVGVVAVATSEDRFHQPWSSVGRRYAIIAAG